MLPRVADLADVQPAAEHDDEVRVLDGEVAAAIADRSRAPREQRMIARDEVVGVETGGYRNAEPFREREKLGGNTGEPHPRSGVEDRTLGHTKALDEPGNVVLARRRRRRLRLLRRIEPLERGRVDVRRLDVHRDVQPYGARASGPRQMNGLLEVIADRRRVGDHHRVLRDGLDEPDDVHFLIAELAQGEPGAADEGLPFHLPRHDDHAERVDPRAVDPGDRVGAAGPGRDVHGGQTVRQAVIALRRDRARLLVVAGHVMQSLAPTDGIVEVHGATTGDEKDVTDSVIGERVGNVVGESHGLGESVR